ncbi:hypothetical protein JCM19239_5332 [Vibrio variabilis]|uniref:Uncharacterized protein n=1 Tax=Vibrio variabilis TaxID=990271 RepID=A0ABQ0JCL5_9VIBR|nr:hypothetical protein JCM19239_5332 [Vibrio variabilis]
MNQLKHPTDATIVRLLQQQGCIKSEARQRLKRDVYQLDKDQISKVQNYAEHFGINAKEKLIDEILDLRRERLITHLSK